MHCYFSKVHLHITRNLLRAAMPVEVSDVVHAAIDSLTILLLT